VAPPGTGLAAASPRVFLETRQIFVRRRLGVFGSRQFCGGPHPPCQSAFSIFGHAYTEGNHGVCWGGSPTDFSRPSAGKNRVGFRSHARGQKRVGLCGRSVRSFAPPLGLSGSPAPSRGCLLGPPGAGSTKPRPPEREPGLLLRLWSLVWSLPRNRCHSRAKPPPPPDCKSAIVGSTPTGASASETPAGCRQQRLPRGFFRFRAAVGY